VVLDHGATDNPCTGEYAELMGVQDARKAALSARFGARHRIEDLVAALDGLSPLQVRWSDGSKSALRIEATAQDFACAGESHSTVNAELRSDVDAGKDEPSDAALVPISLHLSTQDGKLDATLPGIVQAYVSAGEAWNGDAAVYSAMTPISTQDATDWNAILDVPHGDIAILDVSLKVPVNDVSGAQLHLATYRPFTGVPAYPAVFEYASNRLNCFSDSVPAQSFESDLSVH
jgi:hypothetical protein